MWVAHVCMWTCVDVCGGSGEFQIPILSRKGSFIMWLSSTLHSAKLQDPPGTIPLPAGPWRDWRCVVYVCLRPKDEVHDGHLKQLQVRARCCAQVLPVDPSLLGFGLSIAVGPVVVVAAGHPLLLPSVVGSPPIQESFAHSRLTNHSGIKVFPRFPVTARGTEYTEKIRVLASATGDALGRLHPKLAPVLTPKVRDLLYRRVDSEAAEPEGEEAAAGAGTGSDAGAAS